MLFANSEFHIFLFPYISLPLVCWSLSQSQFGVLVFCISALIPFAVVNREVMQVPFSHSDDQPSVGKDSFPHVSVEVPPTTSPPVTGSADTSGQRKKWRCQAHSWLPSLTDCLLGNPASWQRLEQPTGYTGVSKTERNRKVGSTASSLMVSSFCFTEADNVTLNACVRRSLKGWLLVLMLFHYCPLQL